MAIDSQTAKKGGVAVELSARKKEGRGEIYGLFWLRSQRSSVGEGARGEGAKVPSFSVPFSALYIHLDERSARAE